jgi:purine-nucleoside phosphorylase
MELRTSKSNENNKANIKDIHINIRLDSLSPFLPSSSSTMDPKYLSFIPYRLAGAFLKQKLLDAGMASPKVGIICGSGLSGLSETFTEPTLTVQYADIPGFPAHCTVPGHKGEVVFGLLSGVPSMCFRGRFHSYEGHDMKVTVLPVYVMRCLSTVRICIITNAAGALNPDYNIGDVVCVSDHLAIPQLAGKNPLVGPNDDELGPRFPATSDAYPDDLRLAAQRAAKKMGIDFLIPHGVYCFVSGVSASYIMDKFDTIIEGVSPICVL